MQGLRPCYAINGDTDVKKWKYTPHKGNTINPEYYEVSVNLKADGYRLPTIAEWQYAANGGKNNNTYIYSGSDNIDNVGWYNGNTKFKNIIGRKTPNTLGIYDMSGNVGEWVWDAYTTTTIPYNRYICGGSYKTSKDSCTVTYLYGSAHQLRYADLGFRVVRNYTDE